MRVNPSQLRLARVPGEDRLQIRLEFAAPEKRAPIVFEVTFDDAMRLLRGLQILQAKYKIPIPPNLRPRGKPVFAVVTDDD